MKIELEITDTKLLEMIAEKKMEYPEMDDASAIVDLLEDWNNHYCGRYSDY